MLRRSLCKEFILPSSITPKPHTTITFNQNRLTRPVFCYALWCLNIPPAHGRPHRKSCTASNPCGGGSSRRYQRTYMHACMHAAMHESSGRGSISVLDAEYDTHTCIMSCGSNHSLYLACISMNVFLSAANIRPEEARSGAAERLRALCPELRKQGLLWRGGGSA